MQDIIRSTNYIHMFVESNVVSAGSDIESQDDGRCDRR